MQGNNTYLILLVVAVIFLVVPQFLQRRNRKKREQELKAGDYVMTIGGFLGELTYINFEQNVAHLKLAEGVEVSIIPGAISGKRARPEPIVEDVDLETVAEDDEALYQGPEVETKDDNTES